MAREALKYVEDAFARVSGMVEGNARNVQNAKDQVAGMKIRWSQGFVPTEDFYYQKEYELLNTLVEVKHMSEKILREMENLDKELKGIGSEQERLGNRR